MHKNVEIEYKLLLTKEQYESLKPQFGEAAYQQTNYYFDTKDELLRNLRITLRVRLKDDHYEFTLKRSGSIGLDEYNEDISREDFINLTQHVDIQSDILELLKEYNIELKDLCQIYSLTTLRYDRPYKDGLLSLDMSEYLGITDYEIEYEVNDTKDAIKYFNEFLKIANVQYHENCKGKRHRLCDVLYNAPQ